MFDLNSAILGFVLATVGIVVIPFYLMHKETQVRERREQRERKADCP